MHPVTRIVFALLAMFAVAGMSSSAQAAERDLQAISSAAIAAEVEGLGAPDANFVIASVDVSSSGFMGRLVNKAPVGDQGRTQIVQRSVGCSTGCSTGCSMGCSSGCSSGCSVGCSVGCR